ncbi:MAG: oxidoreductase [Rhodocyclaceae bacterium]|nr:oxidoreductase [Rhodocyclaceae bacterium]
MPDYLAVRVARRERLATDILGLTLAPIEASSLPPATPGSHIDVTLPNGLVRQFSIVAHTAAGYELAILREASGRGGSRSVHDDVVTGDVLRISPPRNLFPMATGASRSLLFAGGIGITPILAMAEALAAQGAAFELHYCTRSAQRCAFLARLAQAPYANRVHLYHDDNPATGRLDLASLLSKSTPSQHLYVCGPEGFMEHVLSLARGAGWQEANLHAERFHAAPVMAADDGSFEITLARSGRRIWVAADQTAIAALHAAGVTVPMSCEQGICGTCATRVLDGEIDHRDMFFTDAERAAGNQFTPCCSRARGAGLVLDL